MTLHRFHGGLKLAEHKAEATARAIQRCPLPPRLAVPMLQHAGAPARPCVGEGQRVLGGERIGEPDGERSVPVHAPTSGTVTAVLPHRTPHPGGLEAVAIEIEPDGEDAWRGLPVIDDFEHTDRETLLARIDEAGLVGLGGAVFPAGEKLAVTRELLILNGAECEPWIACDDALLRERADEVVRGGLVLARIVAAERVVLAVEETMPEALAACRGAVQRLASGRIEVIAVPTIYPEGGERQLIRVITGQETPSRGLPRDIGAIVHNVGTAAAAWRAVALGEPLVRRIVTVTGPGIERPGNFDVAIGTPIAFLVGQAGGYTDQAERLLMGGPMMGLALPDDGYAVTKASNCILAMPARELRERQPEVPCIRCGECSRVCPAVLMPQQLYWFIRGEDWQRTTEHGLYDCIECGCCDVVCPSHIPLVDYFRFAKTELRVRQFESEAAAAAKARYEARGRRLEREKAERTARRAKAAAPDAVKATLERARRRTGTGPEGDGNGDGQVGDSGR